MHILNIGLELGATGALLSLPEVVQTLCRLGIQIRSLHVVESDTETTVVIATPTWDSHAVATASTLLGQDCIACWTPTLPVKGHLLGPRAEAWGAFNPRFFILGDGTRLSDALAAVEA